MLRNQEETKWEYREWEQRKRSWAKDEVSIQKVSKLLLNTSTVADTT